MTDISQEQIIASVRQLCCEEGSDKFEALPQDTRNAVGRALMQQGLLPIKVTLKDVDLAGLKKLFEQMVTLAGVKVYVSDMQHTSDPQTGTQTVAFDVSGTGADMYIALDTVAQAVIQKSSRPAVQQAMREVIAQAEARIAQDTLRVLAPR